MKQKAKSASFLWQLSVAVGLILLCVGGLVLLGRSRGDAFREPGKESELPRSPSEAPVFRALPRDVGALLPKEAWLVVLLDGRLFPGAPFADEASPCREAKAPESAAFAAVPSDGADGELSFYLAATDASELFVRCAREKILKARGTILRDDPSGTLLSTPSGTFLDAKDGRVLFSTSTKAARLLPELALGRGTLRAGRHHQALTKAKSEGALLTLSLELPANWLLAAGEDLRAEARLSPLATLEHAEVTIGANGEGHGELGCRPEDAEKLARFLVRAYGDLLVSLPERYRSRFAGALGVRFPVEGRPGVVAVDLSPRAVELGQALLRFATE